MQSSRTAERIRFIVFGHSFTIIIQQSRQAFGFIYPEWFIFSLFHLRPTDGTFPTTLFARSLTCRYTCLPGADASSVSRKQSSLPLSHFFCQIMQAFIMLLLSNRAVLQKHVQHILFLQIKLMVLLLVSQAVAGSANFIQII